MLCAEPALRSAAHLHMLQRDAADAMTHSLLAQGTSLVAIEYHEQAMLADALFHGLTCYNPVRGCISRYSLAAGSNFYFPLSSVKQLRQLDQLKLRKMSGQHADSRVGDWQCSEKKGRKYAHLPSNLAKVFSP